MYSDSFLARLTPLFAFITLPLGILAAIFVGLSAALVVFVVGWLLLTPASAILFGNPTPGPTWADDEVEQLVQERIKEQIRAKIKEQSTDPLDELRARYARGEIDELELERRLDALLEMEAVDPDDEEGIERVKSTLDTGNSTGQAAGGETASDTDSDLLTE